MYISKTHERCRCKTSLPAGLCSRHQSCDADVHRYFRDIMAQFLHFKLKDLLDYMTFLEPCNTETLSKLLRHAFTKHALAEFAKLTLEVHPRDAHAMTISKLADTIVDFYGKLHRANKYTYYIRKLQKAWRAKSAASLTGPYPNTPSVNTEDPFTFEEIASIPQNEIFSYTDQTGHVYAFRASHLLYSIDHLGPYNPYTRESIHERDLARLRRHMRMHQINTTIIDEESRWQTPEAAFTDVLYDYELYGFYTSLEWFTQLSIQQIYDMYYELSTDRNIPLTFFSLSKLDMSLTSGQPDGVGALFCLADDMKNLIKSNHPMKFYIVCNLFVVLAIASPNVRSALPPWVLTGAVLHS